MSVLIRRSPYLHYIFLCFSQIVSGGADKSVIIWDVSSGVPLRRLRGHASNVTCVRFNEESSVALTGSHDNCVMCWDVRSRKNEPIQAWQFQV